MDAEWAMVGLLVVLNLPVFWFLRGLFFRTWGDVFVAIRFWFTPDVWSLFTGSLIEDLWAEVRLILYFGCCGGLVVGEFWALMQFLGRMG